MTTDDIPRHAGSWLWGSARALQRDQLGTYEQAMQDHGDLVRFRVGPPRVGFDFDTTFHPDGARQILGGGADGYVKDAPVYTELRRLLGGGVSMLEGAEWRDRRRLLQPLFTRKHVAAYVPAIAATVTRLVADLAPAAADGSRVDLYDAAMRYGLDVLGSVLFGPDTADGARTLRATVPVVNDYLAKRGLAPVRTPAAWPTPANLRARQAVAELEALVARMIAHQRSGTGGGPLLARLLDAQDPETGQGLDDDDVRDEVLIFLIAGYESTSAALAFTLDLIGRHPDIQERVREEVRHAVGDGDITAQQLPDLVHTSHVVRETLRLYPPVHTLVRRASQGGEVLGCPLPEGRIVAVSTWGIHRRADLWEDPENFEPDRFDDDEDEGRDRYAYLPFGGGPRTCVGLHLAFAELVVAVATLVREYELVTPAGDREVIAGVTLRPATPLWCQLRPAGA
jgi:cytochrome P450